MPDYILKQDALNAIKIAELGQEYEAVERLPVANVEEKKTGKWIPFAVSNSLNEEACMITCSNCHIAVSYITQYCPWCGSENVTNFYSEGDKNDVG